MLTFTITVRPIGCGMSEAYHGSQLLCVSTKPLCDASRVLLLSGLASPRDLIELWHEGCDQWTLRSQIGKAASLSPHDPTCGPRINSKAPRKPVDASICMSMGSIPETRLDNLETIMPYTTEHALLPLAWAEYLAYGDGTKLTDKERRSADREAMELGDLVSFARFPNGTRKDPPLAQCVFVRSMRPNV